MTIQRTLFGITVAQIEFDFKPSEFGDYSVVVLEGYNLCFPCRWRFVLRIFTDINHCVTVNVKCGRSKYVGLLSFSDTEKAIESLGLLQLTDITRVLGSQARTDLTSKILRFLKLPQLAGEATQV